MKLANWSKFNKYEIKKEDKGSGRGSSYYIVPSKEAKFEYYDFTEFFNSNKDTNQQAHIQLINIYESFVNILKKEFKINNIDYVGKNKFDIEQYLYKKNKNNLIDKIREKSINKIKSEVINWCNQYGVLGVFHHFLDKLYYPPQWSEEIQKDKKTGQNFVNAIHPYATFDRQWGWLIHSKKLLIKNSKNKIHLSEKGSVNILQNKRKVSKKDKYIHPKLITHREESIVDDTLSDFIPSDPQKLMLNSAVIHSESHTNLLIVLEDIVRKEGFLSEIQILDFTLSNINIWPSMNEIILKRKNDRILPWVDTFINEDNAKINSKFDYKNDFLESEKFLYMYKEDIFDFLSIAGLLKELLKFREKISLATDQIKRYNALESYKFFTDLFVNRISPAINLYTLDPNPMKTSFSWNSPSLLSLLGLRVLQTNSETDFKNCVVCGKSFYTEISSKKYCGDKNNQTCKWRNNKNTYRLNKKLLN